MEPPVGAMKQALQGNRRAKEALSVWCLHQAFRLAFLDLGNIPNRQAVAEEIAGEASLRAMTYLDQCRTEERLHLWLHQIVRNCVRAHFNRGDRALPRAVYERWVHDFLASHTHELEALVWQELGQEPASQYAVFLQRITVDLSAKTYYQFMRLTYEGRAGAVLTTVQQWLRTFVGLEWVPLYEQDDAGEWVEADLPAAEDTEAQVLHREFIQRVNEQLAGLLPLCRRLLRWYYLDHLRAPTIARLEQMNERTVYRRLESCTETLRARLLRDGYFAEYLGQAPAAPG